MVFHKVTIKLFWVERGLDLHVYSGSLKEKGPHELICLNTWFLVSGTVWEGVWSIILLAKVCHWEWLSSLKDLLCFCQLSLPSACLRGVSSQLLLQGHACPMFPIVTVINSYPLEQWAPNKQFLLSVAWVMMFYDDNAPVTNTLTLMVVVGKRLPVSCGLLSWKS